MTLLLSRDGLVRAARCTQSNLLSHDRYYDSVRSWLGSFGNRDQDASSSTGGGRKTPGEAADAAARAFRSATKRGGNPAGIEMFLAEEDGDSRSGWSSASYDEDEATENTTEDPDSTGTVVGPLRAGIKGGRRPLPTGKPGAGAGGRGRGRASKAARPPRKAADASDKATRDDAV